MRLFLKCEREVTVKGKTTRTVNYAVTSHSIQSATPERLPGLWRDRWSIENRLFWEKDAVLGEDRSRIRTSLAAFAMSIIRNATINYIRASGLENIEAPTRSNILRVDRLLSRLGTVN
jgi:predicted transposase YbfD/YdcC